MNTGKCPKCGRIINNVLLEQININEGFQPRWIGVSYVCPYADCRTIISVSIDPIAVKTDIVKEIKGPQSKY